MLAVAGAPPVVADAAPTAGSAAAAAVASAPVAGFADVIERVKGAVVSVTTRERNAGKQSSSHHEIPDLPDGIPESFRRFFEEHAHRGTPERVQGQGSGFIVDPSGYIVTNYHVVDGAREVTVRLSDGTQHKAQVKGTDDKTDLALLKIDAGKALPYVEFSSADAVRVGDWVLAVGNPFGLGGTVTAGIVSARGREIQSGPYDDYLQIDAPINRGNSGGPLFDTTGKVVGVNTAIYSPSGGSVGIGFAIPASLAANVVQQLKADGHIARGWLGLQLQAVSAEVAEGLGLKGEGGTLVADVLADSPASQAGMRPGDVILSVDGRPLERLTTLPRIVAETKPGTTLTLNVSRKGQVVDVPVRVGSQPKDERLAAADGAGAAKPRLGLALSKITPELRSRFKLEDDAQGVVVTRVLPDSPAERAGIRVGSVISMVGQEPVATPDDVIRQVGDAARENRPTVLLRVELDGATSFVPVQLAS
jgi:serine protease Do